MARQLRSRKQPHVALNRTQDRKSTAISRRKPVRTSKRRSKKIAEVNDLCQPASSFLRLPAELRNLVYEHVIDGSETRLPTDGNGYLASDTRLVAVCRQIRDEFVSLPYFCAPVITARVKDFQFQHVIQFINNLSDEQFNTFTTGESDPERSMIIELVINNKCPSFEPLHSWLQRMDRPSDRISRIHVTYKFKRAAVMMRTRLRQYLNWLIRGTLRGGRRRPEGKVRDEIETLYTALINHVVKQKKNAFAWGRCRSG